MRSIWKGFISFGLVTIPVGVGPAQHRNDVSFRTLSRKHMTPIKQKRWDPIEDVEVGPEDVVKGYEISKGRFVAVEEDELDRFAAPREKTIDILQFVDVGEVDPVHYERAYWLEPQERAERPYALLVEAMRRSGKAAIGRFVLSTKEHLVLLRPVDGALALETLYYPEDIRSEDLRGITERLQDVEVRDQELAMAEQLIEGLTEPFDAARYPNETRASLLDFLEAKAAGVEPAAAAEAPEPAPVIDLMAALRASIEAAGTRERASAGAPAEAVEDESAEEEPAPARGRKRQLSIEEGKLRRVAGGTRAAAPAEEAGGAAEQSEEAAPKRRTRKAS
ncbi:MAG: end-binding protein Ku [Miltoncostaeaceae bacterium]|jgi:DNA end-binding protein Ku|nr:end-binding protein Ku [Miltoncostaeaceae bacterium]